MTLLQCCYQQFRGYLRGYHESIVKLSNPSPLLIDRESNMLAKPGIDTASLNTSTN